MIMILETEGSILSMKLFNLYLRCVIQPSKFQCIIGVFPMFPMVCFLKKMMMIEVDAVDVDDGP